jgi:hypothetical protein
MQERSLKIYKPQDIDDLQDIKRLKERTQEECRQLLEETKQKCVQLEKETYDKALRELQVEQEKLLFQCQKKVSSFFQGAQEDLQSVLKTIFNKLKVEQTSVQTLSQLMLTELDRLKLKSQKFVLYANSVTLPALQSFVREQILTQEKLAFDFDLNSSLQDEECVLESEYVVVRINVNDFLQNVMRVLQNPHGDLS